MVVKVVVLLGGWKDVSDVFNLTASLIAGNTTVVNATQLYLITNDTQSFTDDFFLISPANNNPSTTVIVGADTPISLES